MKIQYILHADFERPGIIETWAQEHQFLQSYSCPFKGEKLPSPEAFDLLIVMGGPQSPLDLIASPYLKEEISLIQKTIELEKPVLGFCLGAQLIGEALGARTQHSPHKEVGVFPITLTEEGQKEGILANMPYTFPVVHWHHDMPGLTSTSKILAFSEGCPRQVIRYLPHVYGFQCHPEAMRKNIEEMIKHCPEDLAPGKYVQSKEAFLSHDLQETNALMKNLLNQFINLLQVPLAPSLVF